MDDPIYSLSQIAMAADLPPNTVRTWLHRGYFWLSPHDQPPPENGMAQLLSLRTAFRLCTMSRLVTAGVHPRIGGEAARQWALIGHDAGGIHKHQRHPGELFKIPLTVVRICGEEVEVIHAPGGKITLRPDFPKAATHLVMDHVVQHVKDVLATVEPGRLRRPRSEGS